MWIKKYIGDEDFYKRIFRVAFPIAMSHLLISCRDIIASIMVSSIGMVTAVGNATNVLNLHNYVLWGIEAGVAIFAAQFFGAKQYKNMAKAQGVFLLLSISFTILCIIAVFVAGDKILLFYLNDEKIMANSLIYLRYVAVSLIFLCITISFKGMYQAMHLTRVAFAESAFYVTLNILNNYLFIFVFDKGIAGAGMAALVTEVFCSAFMIIYTLYRKPEFFSGFRAMFDFDLSFISPIITRILPITFNELLFGFGMSLFNKAYGMLGSASMEAIYIGSQILSMVLFAVWGYGEAVTILVGTLLGKGRIEQAKEESKYHLALSFVVGLSLWLFMVLLSPLFLKLFHIEDPHTYDVASRLLFVYGLHAFFRTFNYVMFCTLKAGGDSKIYNLLDSGIMFTIGIPIAFGGVYFGIRDVTSLVLLVQIEQVIRFFLTLKRYNSYKWANNLTELVK